MVEVKQILDVSTRIVPLACDSFNWKFENFELFLNAQIASIKQTFGPFNDASTELLLSLQNENKESNGTGKFELKVQIKRLKRAKKQQMNLCGQIAINGYEEWSNNFYIPLDDQNKVSIPFEFPTNLLKENTTVEFHLKYLSRQFQRDVTINSNEERIEDSNLLAEDFKEELLQDVEEKPFNGIKVEDRVEEDYTDSLIEFKSNISSITLKSVRVYDTQKLIKTEDLDESENAFASAIRMTKDRKNSAEGENQPPQLPFKEKATMTSKPTKNKEQQTIKHNHLKINTTKKTSSEMSCQTDEQEEHALNGMSDQRMCQKILKNQKVKWQQTDESLMIDYMKKKQAKNSNTKSTKTKWSQTDDFFFVNISPALNFAIDKVFEDEPQRIKFRTYLETLTRFYEFRDATQILGIDGLASFCEQFMRVQMKLISFYEDNNDKPKNKETTEFDKVMQEYKKRYEKALKNYEEEQQLLIIEEKEAALDQFAGIVRKQPFDEVAEDDETPMTPTSPTKPQLLTPIKTSTPVKPSTSTQASAKGSSKSTPTKKSTTKKPESARQSQRYLKWKQQQINEKLEEFWTKQVELQQKIDEEDAALAKEKAETNKENELLEKEDGNEDIMELGEKECLEGLELKRNDPFEIDFEVDFELNDLDINRTLFSSSNSTTSDSGSASANSFTEKKQPGYRARKEVSSATITEIFKLPPSLNKEKPTEKENKSICQTSNNIEQGPSLKPNVLALRAIPQPPLPLNPPPPLYLINIPLQFIPQANIPPVNHQLLQQIHQAKMEIANQNSHPKFSPHVPLPLSTQLDTLLGEANACVHEYLVDSCVNELDPLKLHDFERRLFVQSRHIDFIFCSNREFLPFLQHYVNNFMSVQNTMNQIFLQLLPWRRFLDMQMRVPERHKSFNELLKKTEDSKTHESIGILANLDLHLKETRAHIQFTRHTVPPQISSHVRSHFLKLEDEQSRIEAHCSQLLGQLRFEYKDYPNNDPLSS